MPASSTAPQTVQPLMFRGQPALQMRLAGGDQIVVSLQGAQVLSWTTADGAEHLYLSPRSAMDGHTAIRGGVPICFPQFNQRGPLVKHGFARNVAWPLAGSEVDPEGGSARVHLLLESSEQTRAWWPHDFAAQLTVTLQPGALHIELQVDNRGATAFDFTAALHTYLQVTDIAQVRLHGLDGRARWDAVTDVHSVQQGPIAFDGEYDSVFAAAPDALQLQQPQAAILSIAQSANWGNTVVWNPGAARCAALPDMPTDGFTQMLCVEAACIDQPAHLEPGARWSGWQQLRIL